MGRRMSAFRRLLKIVIGSLFLIAFASLCLLGYLDYEYMDKMPRVAQPELGRVCSWNAHGAVVFITRGQYVLLYHLLFTFISSLVSAIILIVVFEALKSNDSPHGGGQ